MTRIPPGVLRFVRIVVAVVGLLAGAGCATLSKVSASSEVATAMFAIRDARASGAKIYALDVLQRAEMLVGEAQQSGGAEAERHLAEAEEMLESRGRQQLIDHEAEMAGLYAQVAVGRTEAIAAQLESESYMNRARASTLTTRVDVEIAIENARSVDAKQAGRGLALTLGSGLFGFDSNELTSEARLSVARVAGFLIALGNRDARVEGHAESTGGADHNLELSRRRAESIRNALVEFGVDQARLAAEGYGALFPIAENETREGRERKRRVEIFILKPGLSVSEAFC